MKKMIKIFIYKLISATDNKNNYFYLTVSLLFTFKILQTF